MTIRLSKPEEFTAVRTCLNRYLAMAQRIRNERDVTEDLRDEFERNRFSPVCLMARKEAQDSTASACQICALGGRHRGARGCLQEVDALNDYELAAERYMALGPVSDARGPLYTALLNLIREHADLLRSSEDMTVAPKSTSENARS